MQFDINEHPHRRYNPLKDEWILVSPHRAKRPWSGQVDKAPTDELPSYDPTCFYARITTEFQGSKIRTIKAPLYSAMILPP